MHDKPEAGALAGESGAFVAADFVFAPLCDELVIDEQRDGSAAAVAADFHFGIAGFHQPEVVVIELDLVHGRLALVIDRGAIEHHVIGIQHEHITVAKEAGQVPPIAGDKATLSDTAAFGVRLTALGRGEIRVKPDGQAQAVFPCQVEAQDRAVGHAGLADQGGAAVRVFPIPCRTEELPAARRFFVSLAITRLAVLILAIIVLGRVSLVLLCLVLLGLGLIDFTFLRLVLLRFVFFLGGIFGVGQAVGVGRVFHFPITLGEGAVVIDTSA